jgi:hypothetical protein
MRTSGEELRDTPPLFDRRWFWAFVIKSFALRSFLRPGLVSVPEKLMNKYYTVMRTSVEVISLLQVEEGS